MEKKPNPLHSISFKIIGTPVNKNEFKPIQMLHSFITDFAPILKHTHKTKTAALNLFLLRLNCCKVISNPL